MGEPAPQADDLRPLLVPGCGIEACTISDLADLVLSIASSCTQDRNVTRLT